MWQGMKTRQGSGTEALSQETGRNGSATPKSRRHLLALPADSGYAVSGYAPEASQVFGQRRFLARLTTAIACR
jgi:hypothetical protein